jgi:hypothetical protein
MFIVIVAIAGYFAWQRFIGRHEPPRSPPAPPTPAAPAKPPRPELPAWIKDAMHEPPPPFDDWSGVWVGPDTALLWLTHYQSGVIEGRYDPPEERARPCRFAGGRVQGNTASFELKIKGGQLYHCQLQRDGERLTMTGHSDLAGLLDNYDNADRTASGGLLIQPARPGHDRRWPASAAKLSQRPQRQSILAASRAALIYPPR